jgi:predicted nucleic acid-binding protein
MILYCDTSALIKRYVEEEGSEDFSKLWERASAVATSVVAFAETMATFNRKFRERVLSAKEYKITTEEFKEDYGQLVLVPLNRDLDKSIENILKRHPLRGFDAIHLASALVFLLSETPPLMFACFDGALNQAARKEGLNVAIGL